MSSSFVGDLTMLSIVDADCCGLHSGCHTVYGFEHKPGFGDVNMVYTFSRLHVSEISADVIPFLSRSISPGSATGVRGR